MAVLLALPLGLIHVWFAALHFLFPVALVTGHLALRQMAKAPGRYKDRNMALFGLVIGYFNLLLSAVLITAMFT